MIILQNGRLFKYWLVHCIERTVTVDLMDGSLSIEVGGRSESSGTWAYTFLSYIDIVPVD